MGRSRRRRRRREGRRRGRRRRKTKKRRIEVERQKGKKKRVPFSAFPRYILVFSRDFWGIYGKELGRIGKPHDSFTP